MSDRLPDLEILNSVLGTLDLAILSRGKNEKDFRLIGPVPPWFAETFGGPSSLTEHSPFLADFMEGEAHQCWQGTNSRVQSGLWQEETPQGQARFFEATALNQPSQDILIISLANERHDREQDYLQYSHDAVLYQRKLAKERERKEVLLNCIVNDLSNSLSTILMNIQFVENRLEQDSLSKALERAEQQAEQQRTLIYSIADTFDSDLSKLEPSFLAKQKGISLLKLANEAVESSRASAQEKKIRLILNNPTNSEAEFNVVAEQSHLSRIMENLLTHAISLSAEGSTISLQLTTQDDFVKTSLTTSPLKVSNTEENFSFDRTSTPLAAHDSSDLSLYHGQMAIKQWGGCIGQETTPDRRLQIWFELKKSQNANSSGTK